MRILFSACPMPGHVTTVLPLALAAQDEGHEVVFATGADVTPLVRRHGIATWTAGPTHQEAGGSATTDWLAYFARSARRRAADLIPPAVAWRPDLVVAEELELAGPAVAAASGARLVVHGLGAMPSIRAWDALATTIDGLFVQWDLGLRAESVRDAVYLEVCPPALRPAGERIWWHTHDLRPVAGTGGALPAEMGRLPHRDTVHLTLGPAPGDSFPAALVGLASLDVNVVAGVGPAAGPAPFGPQPPHVLLAPHLAHALLLPRCRLVVSQGGSGTMLGAFAHGLPLLVLPRDPDRFANAAAVVRAGAGLSLLPGEVTADAVAAAARRLLTEPSFGASAAWVQVEIASMSPADAVIRSLTAVASLR